MQFLYLFIFKWCFFFFISSHWNALFHACNSRNPEIVKLLISLNIYDLKETDILKYCYVFK